jgi:hypothetical protein
MPDRGAGPALQRKAPSLAAVVGNATFWPSAKNLRARGENPDKAGGVEVSNARNFVDWSQREEEPERDVIA